MQNSALIYENTDLFEEKLTFLLFGRVYTSISVNQTFCLS